MSDSAFTPEPPSPCWQLTEAACLALLALLAAPFMALWLAALLVLLIISVLPYALLRVCVFYGVPRG
jgi:hypothetical protein